MKNLMTHWPLALGLVLILTTAGCPDNGGDVGLDTTPDVGGDAVLCQEDGQCDDDNPCTEDLCVAGVCEWTATDGQCDDGDPCTEGDICTDGQCGGMPKTCDDGVYCNGLEACNPVTGVCDDGAAPQIDDGVDCTLDECNEDEDKVVHVPNDAICDDGNPCTSDICEETLGCQTVILDGEDCEDGSLCTTDDVCEDDVCVGVPVDCDDGEFCNGLETCDADTGDCADGEAPELDDGIDCTVDECDEDNDAVTHVGDDTACDDENSCTVDTCDLAQGCLFDTLDDGEACDDDNECTDDDVCGGGVCLPGKFICVEDCNNEIDDDQDDLIDCDDDDCALDMSCQLGGDLCGEAFDLTLGVPLTSADAGTMIQFFGTTVGKTNVFSGACDPDTAAAADTVHKVELSEALGLQISADFDGGAWAALYILNEACTEDIACAAMDTSDPTNLTVVLQPGTWFITVDGAYPGDVGTYTLDVEVFLPMDTESDCGDGVDNDADGMIDCDDDECFEAEICNILTGETCEDALPLADAPLTNAAVGTQIQIDGTTVGMNDDLAGSCIANLTNTPDLIYTFELTDPLIVDASFDFTGNKWPALYVFADDCMAENELGCVTAKGEAATFNQALPAGTYFMVLDASYNNDAGPFSLTVAFDAVPATEVDCANGIDDDLNGQVDCDDEACGEDPLCVGYDGDNCTKPFLVNDGAPITSALYGQTLTYQGTTDGLQDFYAGECDPDTDGSPDAVYVMEVTDPVVVTATHDFDGTFWPAFYVMGGECDQAMLLGCDTATSGAAELNLALPAGMYYFVIDASYLGDAGPYTFELNFAAPPSNETICYDGTDNDVDGLADCADDDCAADLYCQDIYEPNDTPETAYDLGDLSGGMFQSAGATVSPAAMDVDHFMFSILGDHDISVTLTPAGGLDGKVTILDGDGMTILAADAGGINVAETIQTTLTGPGTYFIWVTGYGVTEGTYDLTVDLTALTEYDCTDGFDQDGDDLVDCCDDDCSVLPLCAAETICVDGGDNDCDGLVDCDDDDCMATAACGAGATCDDLLLINDGVALGAADDGLTLEYWGTTVGYTDDFTGSCDVDTATSPDAVWEITVAETVAVNVGVDYQGIMYPAVYITGSPCGTGDELACETAGSGVAWTGDTVLEAGTYYIVVDGSWAGDESIYQLMVEVTAVYATEVDCGDGMDNDFDGLLDCCDDDCVGAEGCLEICGDGLDNDCDELTDCCDDECAADAACTEVCDDGLDNDCDELIDCCDDECAADAACAAETVCDDGLDNDCDGTWDCGDADCGAVAECEGEGCAAAFVLNDGNPIKQADDGLHIEVTGDTSTAQNDQGGSCDADTQDAKDLVYTFEISEAIGVTISHDFDSTGLWPAVYLFMGDCMADNEIACDAELSDPAVIEPILLQPGTYFVVVDASFGTDAGAFTLALDFMLPAADETDCTDGLDNDLNGLMDCVDPACAADAACEGEICETAFELNGGVAITAADDGLQLIAQGDTTDASADLGGSCSIASASAKDLVYTFTLDEPMGVQVTYQFDDSYYYSAVYVFNGDCVPENEIGCAAATTLPPAVIGMMLYEAGTYYIVADANYSSDASAFTLTVDFVAVAASETDCANGVDDDLDGLMDCCDDDCATDAGCASETVCDDGGDNDCDDLVDCDDPDCAADAFCQGDTCDTAVALDGGLGWGVADAGVFTETGDTSIKADDFQLDCDGNTAAGPDMVYTFTLNETMGVAVSQLFDASGEWEQVYLTSDCGVDATVIACENSTNADPAIIPMTELVAGTYYIIVDGDYASDAGAFTLAVTLSAIATTETDCTDGIDNDLDGFIDCCDDECAADAACLAETVCDDGADNDCDGMADCGDSDCTANVACEGETCASAFMLNGGVALAAGDLPVQFNETGDTTGGSDDLSGSCDIDTGSSPEVVYELVLDTSATLTISHDYPDYLYPAVYVFDAECIADNELACAAAGTLPAVIEDLAVGAGTYYIVVDASWSGDAGVYTLIVDVAEPITVEDICWDGLDNDQDGLADCEDDDCGPEYCAPESLPWEETFTYLPEDAVKGGIWNSDGDCTWVLTADMTMNGFAEFEYGVGCSESQSYWIVGAILDVQACGEISVTFDEAADYAGSAYSHKLAIFDGFDVVSETDLSVAGLTADWASSGPYTFDVSALEYVRVGAGYMGDDADTWRVDNFSVTCTVATEDCDDGIDNDGDMDVDCDDEDCSGFIGCMGESCEDAIPLTEAPVTLADAGLVVVMTGDTAGHDDDLSGSCNSDVDFSADLVYSFTLSDEMYVSGSHDFDGTSLWSAAYIYAGVCESAFELGCDEGNSGASELGGNLPAGTYYVVVDSNWNNEEGPFTLTMTFDEPIPADEVGLCGDDLDNDMDGVADCADIDCATDAACAGASCENPMALSMGTIGVADDGLEIIVTGDTNDATNTYGGSCSTPSESANDVTYVFELTDTMDVSGALDFDSNWYPALYIFGGACDAGNELACDTDTYDAATFDLTLDAGVYYVIADANWASDKGTYTLTLNFASAAPADEVGLCTDGIDNDLDDLIDCLDVDDCAADPGCGDDDMDGVANYMDICDLGSDTVDDDVNDVPDACQVGWAGAVWPNSATEHDVALDLDVFVQVYMSGITDAAADAAGAGIEVNLVYQTASAAEATTVAMAYNADQGNNDEFKATIPASALVSGEDMAVSFEVYYVSGEDMWMYDGAIEDQANVTPISYPITGQAAEPNLYFLEYIEGGSNNKAVEIINAGDAAIDLQGCAIDRYTNGDGPGDETVVFISLAEETLLQPGELWVVCHSSIADTSNCDYLTTSLNHNGNDALALVCGEVTWDVFGKIGENPADGAWVNGDESVSTKDMTLRRKCTVTSGDPDGTDDFDPGVEWDAFAKDLLDGLGSNHCT